MEEGTCTAKAPVESRHGDQEEVASGMSKGSRGRLGWNLVGLGPRRRGSGRIPMLFECGGDKGGGWDIVPRF